MTNYPKLFDNHDLATSIVAFLPWLQYRRWIEEAPNEIQNKLIIWRHNEKDEAVMKNVLHKHNIESFRILCKFQSLDWNWIYLNTSSELFEIAWNTSRHKPFISDLPLDCKHLGHLRVLEKNVGISQDIQAKLLKEACQNQDSDALHWMLNEVQWKTSILEPVVWTTSLLKITKRAISTNQLSFKSIAYMPPECVRSQLKTMEPQEREMLFKYNTQDLQVAAILWLPYFPLDHLSQFDVNVELPAHWDFINPRFPTRLKVVVNHAPQQMGLVDTALASSWPNEQEFQNALHSKIHDFLTVHSLKERMWILKRCCVFGLCHIARAIWNLANPDERQHLEVAWSWASRCTNTSMLQLAIEHVTTPHRSWVMIRDWHYDARIFANIALWQFLISNQMFDSTCFIQIVNQNCIATNLAYCPSEFVIQVWKDHKTVFIKHANVVAQTAFESRNRVLLEFLFAQDDFVVNDDVLYSYRLCACAMGLHCAIKRIQKTRLLDTLCFVYANNIHVARTLVERNIFFCMQTFLSELVAIILCDDTQIESLCFLAQIYHIKTIDLYRALWVSNKGSTLFNSLLSRLYFNIDNVDDI